MILHEPGLFCLRGGVGLILLDFHEDGVADAVPDPKLKELDSEDVGFQRAKVTVSGFGHGFRFLDRDRFHLNSTIIVVRERSTSNKQYQIMALTTALPHTTSSTGAEGFPPESCGAWGPSQVTAI